MSSLLSRIGYDGKNKTLVWACQVSDAGTIAPVVAMRVVYLGDGKDACDSVMVALHAQPALLAPVVE
jgi:hypothetical protein